MAGYQPQFFFRTTNVTGKIGLPDREMVLPGENAVVSVELDKGVALQVGSHFAMREGGKTVGSGIVTQIVE